MSIMDRNRGPKAYHTPAGEADRLRAIIAEYHDFPEVVECAKASLTAHEREQAFVAQPHAKFSPSKVARWSDCPGAVSRNG